MVQLRCEARRGEAAGQADNGEDRMRSRVAQSDRLTFRGGAGIFRDKRSSLPSTRPEKDRARVNVGQ